MRMRRTIVAIVLTFVSLAGLSAQTSADTKVLADLEWETNTTADGLTYKRALVPDLYGGPQHINLVEIPKGARLRYGIAVSEMKKTSVISAEHGALASINGSYYNMSTGSSVCFLKVGKELIDTTIASEFDLRITGAVRVNQRRCQILPWNLKAEKSYRSNKGAVLASGPLMLEDGDICSWNECDSSFIATKHPRSAIFTTKDGKTVFITVDGRSKGNAIGVSIPELAHLVAALGAEDALNLDGGGSTTLWLDGAPDSGVLNCPSDNRTFDHVGERSIPNLIYVYRP